jgi:hypothetical protein
MCVKWDDVSWSSAKVERKSPKIIEINWMECQNMNHSLRLRVIVKRIKILVDVEEASMNENQMKDLNIFYFKGWEFKYFWKFKSDL